jgi:hypothetical protein
MSRAPRNRVKVPSPLRQRRKRPGQPKACYRACSARYASQPSSRSRLWNWTCRPRASLSVRSKSRPGSRRGLRSRRYTRKLPATTDWRPRLIVRSEGSNGLAKFPQSPRLVSRTFPLLVRCFHYCSKHSLASVLIMLATNRRGTVRQGGWSAMGRVNRGQDQQPWCCCPLAKPLHLV